MINTFTTWLVTLVKAIFTGLWDFIGDMAISVFSLVLSAISGLIAAIPAPGFLTQNSIGSLLSQLSPDVLYFVGQMRLAEGFAILGAGFAFRMLRKAVTLGQW